MKVHTCYVRSVMKMSTEHLGQRAIGDHAGGVMLGTDDEKTQMSCQ